MIALQREQIDIGNFAHELWRPVPKIRKISQRANGLTRFVQPIKTKAVSRNAIVGKQERPASQAISEFELRIFAKRAHLPTIAELGEVAAILE